MTCLGRSHCPIDDAGIEFYLSCLPNEAICESGFGRENSGVLELVVMFQAAGVPCHCRPMQMTETDMTLLLHKFCLCLMVCLS
jgi:hypothetical protein